MKRFFLLCLLIAGAQVLRAQVIDSVEMNNGMKSKIKVISLTESTVTYFIPGDASGSTYTVNKSEIKKLYLNTKIEGAVAEKEVIDSILMTNGIKSKIKVVAINSTNVEYKIYGDASGTVYSVPKSDVKKLYLNTDLNKTGSTKENSEVPKNTTQNSATTAVEILDSMLLNNGTKVIIKVISINSDDVQYIIPGDKNGVVYSIPKSQVYRLYLNSRIGGYSNVATSNYNYQKKKTTGKLTDYAENLIGYNMGLMAYNSISINYERIVGDGMLGLRFYGVGNCAPKELYIYSYSYDNYGGILQFMPQYRKFTFGVEFNLFPMGQRTASYYVGPSFQYGYLDCSVYDGGYGGGQKKYGDVVNLSFVLNNGILCRINRNFFMDFSAGIGVQRLDVSGKTYTNGRVSFQYSVGYSF